MTLFRRELIALASAASLQACAPDPDVNAYLGSGEQDSLQRHYGLQRGLADGSLVFGNQTRLLRDGGQAFPAMFQAMQQARDHINLEYFIFEDVEVGGQQLSDLLIGKLASGVTVNIIYDAYGSQATPGVLFDTLRHAGAHVVTFNPLNPLGALTGHSPNDRDHRKIMIVDGRIAFVGGINLSRTYENPPSAGIPADGDTNHAYWRDTAMEIRGPAVAELQKLFFETWKKQNGDPVPAANYFPPLPREGVQTIRIIGSVPGDDKPLYYLSLEQAIRAANSRIWLSTGYFVPPHQEREDLGKAARRGVDLRVVVPSHSDVESAVYAGRAAYGDLLERGAHLFEMQNAVLHSKLAVVDGVWTAIGSSNLDRRSVVFNNEVDAIILGSDTASQVEALLQRDMVASAAVTLEGWQQRAFTERVHELKARVWEYWM
ncbi:MAG TPA: phospholipase D-like domain-containing protein [Acetobacteraceae bacterium]|nr:phospholipase D-like domain-containing protein [Acetobacteraceae bacterium]